MSNKNGVHQFGDIIAINQQYKNKTLDPVDVIKVALKAIDDNNETYNAIVSRDDENVLVQAKESKERYENGKPLSIFDGIPVTVKDSIEVEGLPFYSGTKVRHGIIGEKDAAAVTKLRAGGAIIVGKTTCSELTMSLTSQNTLNGPVKNPQNSDLDSGGSSAGDAAAIKLGIAKLGLGSDLAGSLRIPAAWTGVSSYKPTPGIIPNQGHFPSGWNDIAVVGAIAGATNDLCVALGQLSQVDGLVMADNESSGGLANYSFAVVEKLPSAGIEPIIADALDRVASDHVLRGSRRVKFDSELLDVSDSLFWHLGAGFGGDPDNTEALLGFAQHFGKGLTAFLGYVQKYPATLYEFAKAEALRKSLIESITDQMSSIDYLLAPASPVLPQGHECTHVLLENREVDIFTAHKIAWVFSLLGFPVVSVAVPLSNGTSTAVQIIGKPFSDTKILEVAQRMVRPHIQTTLSNVA